MVVTVRHKDMPWEEFLETLTPLGRSIVSKNPNLYHERYRGKDIQIEVPAYVVQPWDKIEATCCNGPFYRLVHRDGADFDLFVCSHTAEIGD